MPMTHAPIELLAATLPALLPAFVAATALARPAHRVSSAVAQIAGVSTAFIGLLMFALPATPAARLPALMLALSGFLAWVIARFSVAYLAGDAQIDRYFRQLLVALASVWGLVASDNLLVILLAWAVNDLALNGLLLHFGERPNARLAARKRLLVMGLANLLLLAGTALLASRFHSVQLSELAALVANHSEPLALPALLLTLGCALKCAPLPVHGWLLQVMEAPTPVSALLHAGVVNMGGVVLLKLQPLVAGQPLAATLLVVIGATSAIVASLVMTTRISIKVALAWSTCAQMGFMLLEIGLGAPHLALLHIAAHSLYKAHAFLTAGNTVVAARIYRIDQQAQPTQSAMGTLAVLAVGIAVLQLADAHSPASEQALHIALLCGLAGWLDRAAAFPRRVLVMGGFAAAIVVLEALLGRGFASTSALGTVGADPVLALAVAVGFGACLLLVLAINHWPASPLVRRLHAMAFAGFFLDELFSRLALRLQPAPRTTTRWTVATDLTTTGAKS